MQAFRHAILLKREFNIGAFLQFEIWKIFKSIFFTVHFRWLLLEISDELSLYCIWEWWIVSLCGTYWLSSAYFILLRMFRFFLFLLLFIFFVDFTTCLGIEVIEVNASNKVVEVFLDSWVEFRGVSCFSFT